VRACGRAGEWECGRAYVNAQYPDDKSHANTAERLENSPLKHRFLLRL